MELPEEVVPDHILSEIIGQVVSIEPVGENQYKVQIKWPLENTGGDRTQFLNMLYGNISLKRGIKVSHVHWPELSGLFKGPGQGIDGVRELVGIHNRPMACAVLKPMGLNAEEFSDQAFEFSAGGIDLIKDDHGLANQSYAPFQERVEKVVAALKKSEAAYGRRAAYFPNITVSGSRLMQQYKSAFELGADGVMVLPELCGYEAMHELAASDIDLPIIAHPSFSGTFVTDPEHGFTPAFLYGELYRAFGADCTVYPNTGGRFSFSQEECLQLNEAARTSASPFNPVFPMPGGGMKRETLPHWIKEYGNDTVFLLGASMLQHPEGIRQAAMEVSALLKNTGKGS